MDYIGVLKKSWQITINNKFLWLLGLLAALTENIITINTNFGNINSQDINKIKNWWNGAGQNPPEIIPNSNLVHNQVLGEKITIPDYIVIKEWILTNLSLVISICLILLILMIFILIISKMANGGLIWAVNKINDHDKTNFSHSFRKGFKLFWKIFILDIIISIIMLAVLMIYAAPIIFFILLEFYIGAIIWGLILILPLVPFSIILSFIRTYALRYVVIKKNNPSESFHLAWNLFQKKIKEILIFWLLSLAINFVLSMIILMIIILPIITLITLGITLFFTTNLTTVIIYTIIIGLIFAVILLFIRGFIYSFISSYWTLSFVELEK